jgi:hypothetical protein
MCPGNEGFYMENGEKADADIHHPILDAVDDTEFRVESFYRAVQAGTPPEMAARMFGLEGGYELGGGSLAPLGIG